MKRHRRKNRPVDQCRPDCYSPVPRPGDWPSLAIMQIDTGPGYLATCKHYDPGTYEDFHWWIETLAGGPTVIAEGHGGVSFDAALTALHPQWLAETN